MATAAQFIEELNYLKTEKELEKLEKYFKGEDGTTRALGVKFGDVFSLAEKYSDMPLSEINLLLDSEYYEVRMGAVSIMDFQARDKKSTPGHKKKIFDLYFERHDRLNNWDFIDRAAPSVVGNYLLDKNRDILYELAKSENTWERRTAIVSTYAFIRRNELDDTFKISEILINDKVELINKAVGSWLREAGKKDPKRLKHFLEKHAATMPRVTLRYALEKFDQVTKDHFMKSR